MVKPPAPEVLCTEGAAKRAEHEAAYDLGVRHFEFDRRIYSHETVRELLARAQHGKCCFCESKVQHVADGDVEHFRPKAGVRQARSEPLEKPGYYWLAYDWANLYFACQSCNQRNKQNLFPLADPTRRVRSHHGHAKLDEERPLFIDPGCDDPEQILGYRDGEPFAIDGCTQAEMTRRALELERPFLMERRWERLELLRVSLSVIECARLGRIHDSELVTDAAVLLATSTRDDAEFSAMIRCWLRDQFGSSLRMPLAAESLFAYASGGPLPTDATSSEPSV
ncbi:MAG: hypothetical protein R6X02_19210 [Enhygromyxa sp.]